MSCFRRRCVHKCPVTRVARTPCTPCTPCARACHHTRMPVRLKSSQTITMIANTKLTCTSTFVQYRKTQCYNDVDCAHNHPRLSALVCSHAHPLCTTPHCLSCPPCISPVHSLPHSLVPSTTVPFARDVEVPRGSLTALDVGAGIGRVTKHVLIPAGFGKVSVWYVCCIFRSVVGSFHSWPLSTQQFVIAATTIIIGALSSICGRTQESQSLVTLLLHSTPILKPPIRFSRIT